MSALPSTPIPSQSSVKTVDYRVTRVAFGNGYEQRAPDGLNAKRDAWTLVYENLTSTQLSTMTAFFDGLAGATYFTWAAYGDSSSKNWITKGTYSLSVSGGNVFTLSVPIEQVFDL